MHFSTWMWDRMEEPNRVGLFSKLCWTDVNNGCAHATFNAIDWMKHFEARHPENKEKLITTLAVSYRTYVLSIEPK